MEVLFSKFRKKKTTFELLEHLDNQISSLNNVKARTMVQQKKVLGFLTYSVVLYLILALVFYFKVYPAAVTRQEQFMVILPFLAFPGLIWGIKKFFTWWYHKKVMRDDRKLELLKEKKTKLLEEVMEKETYKVAMQILEKFGKSQPVPSLAAANIGDVFRESAPGGLVRGALGEGGNLIRRVGKDRQACLNNSLPVITRKTTRPSKLNTTLSTICSPTGKAGNMHATAGASDHPLHRPLAAGGVRDPVLPLPRPVLARDRGYLDKFVELLVGDGPANRYALICSQCQSHNGMALREEFLFLAYRCCYCYYWNPARKQRPVAPRLPVQPLSTSSLSSVPPTQSRGGSVVGRVKSDLAEKAAYEPVSDVMQRQDGC